MPVLWGIHNDQPSLELIAENFISIGWDDLGDLQLIGPDKEQIKQRLGASRPDAKAGAIPVWAGVLMRFAFAMKQGDYVVAPNKADSTLSFGRIDGDYKWVEGAEVHKHRRSVAWLTTGVPRATFSKNARYEIGSAVTLFKVKTHRLEFLNFLGVSTEETAPKLDAPDQVAEESAEDEPNADRIETYTRDFVIETLQKEVDTYRFEYFVAALLQAMGYEARVTQASGDGGVDVIAHRDPLGLQPPIIKVQCKRTVKQVGGPDVQKLIGTLAPSGTEVGLFVTLGAYSADAMHIERTRQDLRLINGTDLVGLLFAHYESLTPDWKRLLPMRSVYVIDREPEA